MPFLVVLYSDDPREAFSHRRCSVSDCLLIAVVWAWDFRGRAGLLIFEQAINLPKI